MTHDRWARLMGVLAALVCTAVLSGCAARDTHDKPAAPQVSKLLVFVVENHSFDQVRDKMSYVRSLADRFGYAENYFGMVHPSLPNYLVMVGGDDFGVDDDKPPSDHKVHGPSVFGATLGAGGSARLYADGMQSNCQHTSTGTYAVKHNPWPYFVDEAAECRKGDVPLSSLAGDVSAGHLPTVGMVIPDLCNDAHDCSLRRADRWMRNHVGAVLAGPDWHTGHLAVIITADEDDRKHDNRILTVVAHPSLNNALVTKRLDHRALSRAYAEVAGISPLRRAADAPSLLDAFGLDAKPRIRSSGTSPW